MTSRNFVVTFVLQTQLFHSKMAEEAYYGEGNNSHEIHAKAKNLSEAMTFWTDCKAKGYFTEGLISVFTAMLNQTEVPDLVATSHFTGSAFFP